ncbi:MAG TPA: hypothetical protein VI485_19695 [Vicinamibacterales bacterium]|nr:hypothetical protein [Vicinamibacterales bacterium]
MTAPAKNDGIGREPFGLAKHAADRCRVYDDDLSVWPPPPQAPLRSASDGLSTAIER